MQVPKRIRSARHFSSLTTPLSALCSPRARFSWGDAEEWSIDAPKAALSAPGLRVRDRARPANRRLGARCVCHP